MTGSNGGAAPMPSRFNMTLIALAAVAIALLAFLAVALLVPVSSVKTTTTRFSLPGALPTAPENVSDPLGCGANLTHPISLGAHSQIDYYISDNQSADTVDYWVFGGTGAPANGTVAFGEVAKGGIDLGATGAALEFVFRGCGSTVTVLYGFWGSYTIESSG